MPQKLISNDIGAWSAGATWQTNTPGNTSTQVVGMFVNGWTGTLYTGDVVICNVNDATCVQAVATATPGSIQVVGVVGGTTNQAASGGAIPLQTPPTRFDSGAGTTSASATVTDTAILAGDVGKGVSGPGIPAGAYILSVTAGTSFVMSANATATGTITVTVGPRQSSVGPGYLAVPTGEVMPVVQLGW